MKVLFVGSAPAPTAGGAHGFISTVLAALNKVPSPGHTFHFGETPTAGYDFTWFLSPDSRFNQCTTPFAFSVWDLGHRMLPAFPEVSLSGWKFDSREARYREALPRAALVVASAECVKQQVHEFYRVPLEMIGVFPEPVNPVLEAIEGDTGVLDRHGLQFSKYLLMPAQFWPHKNHITAIDALTKLPDFKLVLTGADKGNRKHVFNYARSVLPKERVIFTDFVTLPELVALYRNAHATLALTLLSAHSLPAVEAHVLGCPVLEIATVSADVVANYVTHGAWHLHSAVVSDTAYALRVVDALDNFSRYRRLWGANYVHL